jgi:hypothetical protein
MTEPRARSRAALFRATYLAVTAVAGAVGALWDEHWHAGFSQWISLCRNGEVGVARAVVYYSTLLPVSTLAILTTALLSLLSAWHNAPALESRREVLVGHAACIAAMPFALVLCTAFAEFIAPNTLGVTQMFALDFAATLLAAQLMARVLRSSVRFA